MAFVRRLIAAALALVAVAWGAPASAQSCEDIRDGIASRMRGHGLSEPTLVVVSAEALESKAAGVPQGRVVGTCGRGTQRIVHVSAGSKAISERVTHDEQGRAIITETASATRGEAARPAPPKPQRESVPKAAPREITECRDGSERADCGP